MYLIDLEKIYSSKNFDKTCNGIKSLVEKGIRKVICRHCEDAGCISACPQDALKKIDGELKRATFLCTGCKTCMLACPFGVNIDEIVEYKNRPMEELDTILKSCPYIDKGKFEETEDIVKIEENIFVKGTNWKKQIGLVEKSKIKM